MLSSLPSILMYLFISIILCFVILLNLIPLMHKCKRCDGNNCTYCETKSSKILEVCIISFLSVIILASLFLIAYKRGLLGSFKNEVATTLSDMPDVKSRSRVVPHPIVHRSRVVPPVATTLSDMPEVKSRSRVEPPVDSTPVVDPSVVSTLDAQPEELVKSNLQKYFRKVKQKDLKIDQSQCELLKTQIIQMNKNGEIGGCQKILEKYTELKCHEKEINGTPLGEQKCD